MPALRDGQPSVLRAKSMVPGGFALPLDQIHVANPIKWDMNVWHTYYYVPWGRGNVGGDIWEGPNPPGPQTRPPRLPYVPPPPGK